MGNIGCFVRYIENMDNFPMARDPIESHNTPDKFTKYTLPNNLTEIIKLEILHKLSFQHLHGYNPS